MTLALRAFDAERFLRDVWQKCPLLIRDAWQEWSNPIEPDELAGLACETEMESRLVRQPRPDRWELEHGPFAPDHFGELGEGPWTLLVQAVDQHNAAVAALIEPFRFIPDWRIDDVMVSYATDGGGVGPHFDQYDVFLIQGLGRRRWRVGRRCDGNARLLPHDGLRLLSDFEPVEEWVLEPGDILYLPPGFSHDGVAESDDCMTYSVGFRAPSRGDLVSAFADHVLDTLDEDDRYTDGNILARAHPGEISVEALARLHDMVTGALADRDSFAAWFGRYITAPKDERIDWTLEEPIATADLTGGAVSDHVWFERNLACRFSFIRHYENALTLFVDGESYACTGPAAAAAERICVDVQFALAADLVRSPTVAAVIVDLVNRGCLAVSEPD